MGNSSSVVVSSINILLVPYQVGNKVVDATSALGLSFFGTSFLSLRKHNSSFFTLKMPKQFLLICSKRCRGVCPPPAIGNKRPCKTRKMISAELVDK